MGGISVVGSRLFTVSEPFSPPTSSLLIPINADTAFPPPPGRHQNGLRVGMRGPSVNLTLTLCLPPQHILIVQRQLSVLDEELEEFRAALRQYMDCACAQTGCLQSVQGCCCVVLLCCFRHMSQVKAKQAQPIIVGCLYSVLFKAHGGELLSPIMFVLYLNQRVLL